MANFRPDFKSLKKFLHLLKYSVQCTNVKLCLYIWRTHRQYYHLPPPPFLLHPAQTFKIMSGGKKKKKKSGEATPTDSFNPQYDHFFVYVLNTKNVPCAVGIQVSTGTHLVAWRFAVNLETPLWQWKWREAVSSAAAESLPHITRSPLSWINLRTRLFVLCYGLIL